MEVIIKKNLSYDIIGNEWISILPKKNKRFKLNRMKKTLVVNFFGGPGSCKSTMMAHCFAELKWKGIDCEISSEYIKEKIWEGSSSMLENQFYISAKQNHRLYNLNGKVNVILTDSPLLLGIVYAKNEPEEFKGFIIKHFNEYNNLNIFLERQDYYNENGRIHNKEQAIKIDKEVMKLVNTYCDNVAKISANRDSVPKIIELIEDKLKTL